jgi:hypothetical protein
MRFSPFQIWCIHEVVVADAVRGVSHAGQAEIGAVREHRGQERRLVRRRVAGAQMCEAISKAGPGIDVAQPRCACLLGPTADSRFSDALQATVVIRLVSNTFARS